MPSILSLPVDHPRPVDLRQSTDNIENNFVGDSTKDTYYQKLVIFMMWLFDNHQAFICDNILTEMKEKDAADDAVYRVAQAAYDRIGSQAPQQQQMGPRGRRRTRKPKAPPTRTRAKLRTLIMKELRNMKAARGAGSYRCPIIIEGDGAITYELVSDFMTGKFNTQFIDRESALAYLKANSPDGTAEITDDMCNSEGKVLVQVQQSKSMYDGIRSAITYLYTRCRVTMPEKLSKEMSTLIAGLDRTGANEAQSLGLAISKGKKPISLEAYELLAKKTFNSGKKEDVFTHLFLVLDWSLMKRAENCVNAQIEHIYFLHDALVFEFAKSKVCPTGEKGRGPWHVYANPHKPWLCPVLALARYLLCYPEVLRGGSPLFEGTNQYRRYNTRFANLVSECSAELKNMGFEKADLGTHSCRKGVATMVAAGCTVSPPIVALCIRAGWVLGGVKDKYLFREGAGDQYVGRCASCLDQLTKEFAVSPPYFDFTNLDDATRIIRKAELKTLVKERVPEYEKIGAKTRHVLEMCFASICYHHKTLMASSHPQCPLRSSPLFRDIPPTILELACIAYPWNKTNDTPQLTGIPPHILALAEMEELKREIMSLESKIVASLREELDSRGFGSTEFNAERFERSMQQQTNNIVTELLKRTSLTERAILEAKEQRDDEFAQFVIVEEDDEDEMEGAEFPTEEARLHHDEERQKRSMANVQARVYTVGFHHGKLNPLPATYQFPFMTPQQLVQNWLLGDREANVPPLKTLRALHVEHVGTFSKKDPTKRNKRPTGPSSWQCMQAYMEVVEKLGKAKGCWKDSNKDWNYVNVNALWTSVGPLLMEKYMAKSNRKKELSWKTVYNKMSKNNDFHSKRNKRQRVS